MHGGYVHKGYSNTQSRRSEEVILLVHARKLKLFKTMFGVLGLSIWNFIHSVYCSQLCCRHLTMRMDCVTASSYHDFTLIHLLLSQQSIKCDLYSFMLTSVRKKTIKDERFFGMFIKNAHAPLENHLAEKCMCYTASFHQEAPEKSSASIFLGCWSAVHTLWSDCNHH